MWSHFRFPRNLNDLSKELELEWDVDDHSDTAKDQNFGIVHGFKEQLL